MPIMASCIDCGNKVSRREYTRCRSCKNKFLRGENSPFYKGLKNNCIDCNKLIKLTAKRCGSCAQRGELNHQYKNGQVIDRDGYILILVPNHPYSNNKGRVRKHRLIMEQHIGRYLERNEYIDHINGDKADNRIENLRLATKSENAANQKLSIRNTSGFKGVTMRKKDKKWIAQIKYHQKLIWLGSFKTKEEAAIAYDNKAKELFGDFASLNFPKNNS